MTSPTSTGPTSTGPTSTGPQPGLAATVGLYTIARAGLVALVAALLLLAGVPLVIALLVALIVALPLSMVLFRGLRARLDEALATARDRRRRERDALRARLRGDEPSAASGEAADGEADRGQH
jgi:Flp pilus assembly protein TadB